MTFYIHVYVHREAKKPLLLTCRAWYKIATEDPTLWRTIAFGGWIRGVHSSDTGKTLDDLARNIQRTWGTTFTLLFQFPPTAPEDADIQRFVTTVDRDWLSRCRSLELRGLVWQQYSIKSLMNDVLLPPSGHFAALECFSVEEMEVEDQNLTFGILIQRVAASAMNLRSLGLASGARPCAITAQVFQHVNMLRRIQRLLLHSVTIPVPWREFTHLEHLEYVCEGPDQSNLAELSGPHLKSLCLDTDSSFVNIDLPTHALFKQLTHLVLRTSAPVRVVVDGSRFPRSLPCLTYLGIQPSTELVDFGYIEEATNLAELSFVKTESLERYPTFRTITFSPCILRLDILSSQRGYPEFGHPLEVWRHVEELHLTVCGLCIGIDPTLVQALSQRQKQGNSHEEDPVECFPCLRIITVQYPYGAEDLLPETKQRQTDRLMGIARRRKESGMRQLEKLKIGWYRIYGEYHVLGQPSTEWPVTEWKDCSGDPY